jgi:deoxycytidine triphosphate deaminase
MSIRPMDFQVMYPKTSELSKTFSDEANKNQAIIQQQTEHNRERIDNSLKQVVARENVKNGRVDEKKEKDNSKQNEKKKKQKDTRSAPTIDIKI